MGARVFVALDGVDGVIRKSILAHRHTDCVPDLVGGDTMPTRPVHPVQVNVKHCVVFSYRGRGGAGFTPSSPVHPALATPPSSQEG